ncbi:TPA: mechanosensitive ion channel family protein [Candidatus Scatousia excrementigallinarum]|uniref:Mechanosensitive ion channel family protein n=1 Tax=Candidatus Scatousia excrementigallinarum TaxID=2840935 RepID=A0A9D1EYF0_9BACT|nr:mechanosensitive ion channel family protein [Candidatus Scatousia excrementigallinarum]
MLNEILDYLEKIQRVLATIHFDIIVEVIVNIVILGILFKAVDIFENKMKKKFTDKKSSQLVKFIPILTRILKFIVFFILIAALLQNHGYSVSSLIAGFGITGLAVGFAANATIANVFGTIAILSDKAFEVGDYIKLGTIEGTVEDINLRSTKIRTLDNALTIIPNSKVADGEIVNVTKAHKRRILETFGVTYDTSDEKLKRAIEIIEEVLNSNSDIYSDYVVFLDTLADSSINIKVSAYVKTNNYVKYLKIKEIILLNVIKRFREEGIDFAFPSRTLYMAK